MLCSLHDWFTRLNESLQRNRIPGTFFDQPGQQLLDAFDEEVYPIIVERHKDQLVVIIRCVRDRDLASFAAAAHPMHHRVP